jgi:hypothetical protein
MRKNHRVRDPGEVQDSKVGMPRKTPASGSSLSTDRFLPLTLVLGLATIFLCETLLLIDVSSRGWVVIPDAELSPPSGLLQTLARWFAVNTTPISWVGLLVLLDGLLVLQSRRGRNLPAFHGSPVRERPKRFILCFLVSVPLWLLFDWINFSFMGAWEYHGLPENLVHRYTAYFFAFGAIFPAMFLFAQLYQGLGLHRVSGRKLYLRPLTRSLIVVAGLLFVAFPIAVQAPIGSLTLWLGWLMLLDPINHRLGAPSLLGDWQNGRWGRTLGLLGAGATCGLLWEFWNYWAAAKWTYDLAFLGPLEGYRYFEMPWPGFLGFPVFALECWVMFQTVTWLCEKLRLVSLEPLPDHTTLL